MKVSSVLLPTCFLLLSLNACKKAETQKTPAGESKPSQTAAEGTKKTTEAVKAPAEAPSAAAPTTQAAEMPASSAFNNGKVTEPVDIGDFGSDEPIERANLPSRGVIVLGNKDYERNTMAHWEQFDWRKFQAKRWGRYQVRLTYSLTQANLGIQFRMADFIAKEALRSSFKPRKTYLGNAYIPQAGELPFSLLAAASAATAGFSIQEVALIPAPESDDVVQQAADGSLTLLARNATTWSETMRYEPKPEKNCLGYWVDPNDFAEWEFNVEKPGRFKVAVFQGCGGGNEGSEVEIKQGEQSLKFIVQDTGGFQNWKEVAVGEIEVKTAGVQRLVIDPINKVKSAVLDVQKVVLTPVP